MKKLGLFALVAASTALIPATMAQAAPNGHRGSGGMGFRHGGRSMGAPRMAPRAGHSWGQGRMNMPQMPHTRPPMGHNGPRMGGQPPQMHHGSPPKMHTGGPVWSGHGGKGKFGGHHFKHRIDRGGKVSRHWSGGRFNIRNWNLYGFYEPFAGGHWIRYYDDALLVDQYGRVYDGRYGIDWDRYGESWNYDDDGIPAYAGDGDYEPEDRDWAEDEDRRDDELAEEGDYGRDGHGYPPPPPGYPAPPPPPPPPAGYGRGYYGHCGCGYAMVPVTVTETITTTAPVVEPVTTYHYVKSYSRPVVRTKDRPIVHSKDRPVVRYK